MGRGQDKGLSCTISNIYLDSTLSTFIQRPLSVNHALKRLSLSITHMSSRFIRQQVMLDQVAQEAFRH